MRKGLRFLLLGWVLALGAPESVLAWDRVPTISKSVVRRLPQHAATHRVLALVAASLSRDQGGKPHLSAGERQAILLGLFRTIAEDSTLVTPQFLYAVDDGDVRQAPDRLEKMTVFSPDPMARSHPRFPLHEYTLATGYRATAFAGVCVARDVTVLFEPIGKGEGPSAPVRASGVDINSYYHLLIPPSGPVERKSTAEQRAATARGCAKLDFGSDGEFLSARNDLDAIEGAWQTRTVIEAARSGNPPFELVSRIRSSLDQKGAKVISKSLK